MPVESPITFHKAYRKLWDPLPPNKRREAIARLTQRKRDPLKPNQCGRRCPLVEKVLQSVLDNWTHKNEQARKSFAERRGKNSKKRKAKGGGSNAKTTKGKRAKREESTEEEESEKSDESESEEEEAVEEEDAETGEKLFEVEAILDRDSTKGGNYLVRWKGNWPADQKHSWEPRRCLGACPELLAKFDEKHQRKLDKKNKKAKELNQQRKKDRAARAAAAKQQILVEEEKAKARLTEDVAGGRRRSARAARTSYVEYNSGGELSESYGDLSTETECDYELSDTSEASEYSDAEVQPGSKPGGFEGRKHKPARQPRRRKRAVAGARKRPKYKGPLLPGTPAFELLKDVTDGDKLVKEMLGKEVPEFFVGIISKERSENVQMIHAMFTGTGVTPTWFVGEGEAEKYRAAGATEVQESGGLCASRNAALDAAAAAGKVCVQMSDDITSIQIVQNTSKYVRPSNIDVANARARKAPRWRVSPVGAAHYLFHVMTTANAKLGGAYPNCNHGFAFQQPPTSPDLFIVGDFLVCDVKNNPLRFDQDMTLKEDYDFTAQHLHKYGHVCRSNRLFVKAQHYTNPGGAVAVRTASREQENIAILRRKWPEVFRRHGTRGPNEVLMRWKRLDRSAMAADLAKAGLAETPAHSPVEVPIPGTKSSPKSESTPTPTSAPKPEDTPPKKSPRKSAPRSLTSIRNES